MAHLAVVDAVICGMVLPLKLHAMLTGTHNVGCKVFGPVVIAMMILSLLSLANIALNRYVLVCKDPQVCLHECTSTRVFCGWSNHGGHRDLAINIFLLLMKISSYCYWNAMESQLYDDFVIACQKFCIINLIVTHLDKSLNFQFIQEIFTLWTFFYKKLH